MLGIPKKNIKQIKEKGLALFLFFLLFLVNSFPIFLVKTPLFTDEYLLFTACAGLTGFNWSGVIETLNGGASFMQIIYSPFFFTISDSILLYKVIIMINASIMALIAPLSFLSAKLLGIENNLKAFAISLGVSITSVSFVNTSIANGNQLAFVSIWLTLYFLLKAKACNNWKRLFYALMLGGSVALQGSSVYLILFMFLSVFIIYFIWKALKSEKLFLKRGFILGFVSVFALQIGTQLYINAVMAGKNSVIPEREFLMSWLNSLLPSSISFSKTFARCFYLITSTWGLGAIALTMAFMVVIRHFRSRVKGSKITYYFGNNTLLLALFTLLSFISVLFSSQLTSLFTNANPTLNESSSILYTLSNLQNSVTLNMGALIDILIPILIFFGLYFLFRHGFTLKRTIFSIVTTAYLIAMFCFLIPSVLTDHSLDISSNIGLISLAFTKIPFPILSINNIIAIISITATVMLIILTTALCGRKDKGKFYANGFILIILASTVITGVRYFPERKSVFEEKISMVSSVPALLFNETGAPKVSLFGLTDDQNAHIQFVNRKVKATAYKNMEEIPAETIIVMSKYQPTTELLKGRVFKIAQTGDIFIYAYGDQAINYAVSKNIIEEWELNENNNGIE